MTTAEYIEEANKGSHPSQYIIGRAVEYKPLELTRTPFNEIVSKEEYEPSTKQWMKYVGFLWSVGSLMGVLMNLLGLRQPEHHLLVIGLMVLLITPASKVGYKLFIQDPKQPDQFLLEGQKEVELMMLNGDK